MSYDPYGRLETSFPTGTPTALYCRHCQNRRVECGGALVCRTCDGSAFDLATANDKT